MIDWRPLNLFKKTRDSQMPRSYFCTGDAPSGFPTYPKMGYVDLPLW